MRSGSSRVLLCIGAAGLVLFFSQASFAAAVKTGAQKAAAAEDPKLAKIRKIMRMANMDQTIMMAMDQMIATVRPQLPNVPYKFWADFKEEVVHSDVVLMFYPIFNKYMTETDLDEVIKFYESSAGRKFLNLNTQAGADIQRAGQQFGMKLSEKLQKRLRDQGYMPKE